MTIQCSQSRARARFFQEKSQKAKILHSLDNLPLDFLLQDFLPQDKHTLDTLDLDSHFLDSHFLDILDNQHTLDILGSHIQDNPCKATLPRAITHKVILQAINHLPAKDIQASLVLFLPQLLRAILNNGNSQGRPTRASPSSLTRTRSTLP